MAGIPSEFEEREFEAPLYNQLERGNPLVWSPGQVFEQYIGIDRALFLSDPGLWRYFGKTMPLRGIVLGRLDLEFIWDRRRRRPLPNFKLNLFIQAKRSYFHKRTPKPVRGLLPEGSCWHFKIDSDQQEALGKVSIKLGNRAVVCYAAPAFHRISQLYAHTARGTIMEASTFPLAQKLTGHDAFFYSVPGGSGVANPEVENIIGVGLGDMLHNITSNSGTVEGTPTEQLVQLAHDIENVVAELPDQNPRKGLFVQQRATALGILEGYEEAGQSARAFVRVGAFVTSFNLDWYVVGR